MDSTAARRHVVITGAAGALGRAVASRFAAEGARLALIDRDGAPPAVDDLAAACGLSRFHFMRCFRQTVGVSPGAFIREARIARAKALLAADGRPLADLARELGYAGLPAFSAAFRKATGRSPGAYRAFMR